MSVRIRQRLGREPRHGTAAPRPVASPADVGQDFFAAAGAGVDALDDDPEDAVVVVLLELVELEDPPSPPVEPDVADTLLPEPDRESVR